MQAPFRPVAAGIVHFGLGAFHRVHQAVYTEDAMRASGDHTWGIVGVSSRMRPVLAKQNYLYTVVERGEGAAPPRVVGALAGVAAGAQVPDLLARPAIRVVTLTVTEKGYRHDPATGRLDLADPGIAADLAGKAPVTVVGQLVHGLRRRLAGPPITVVCCDNLPGNGKFLRTLVRQFCEAAGSTELAGWIEDNVRFPGTMVDRIAPAVTTADLAGAEHELGYRDDALVVTEPFSQWVIEDSFATGRPAWDEAGAVLTADVEPWERLKLRVLNASHSMLAYFGLLVGHESIADAVHDPVLRDACTAMLADDVLPVLDPPSEVDFEEYVRTTLARFANRALRHTTAQVASDGSQKVGPRLLETVTDLRAAGREPRWLPFVVAAWTRHVETTEHLVDPLATELRAAALPLDVIFPGDPAFRARVVAAHHRLAREDPRAVLQEVLDGRG
ncbi:mannitol dehydrogenase family protein [Amycolatopsis jiangsuensis]|uniref:Mannitol-1-phosphate 5-dehydrogenase n=1 Tax=Amycolatopsis jiangsuensis TaxID=1181879 RepID=A0A840J3Y3_9PSEU|nr:mannitol dehydrogenase family protein [Amycolatopsis jiangsuensis]MBB4688147.1 fructuronate reductase [Amycolatopsis jiangsuensis]